MNKNKGIGLTLAIFGLLAVTGSRAQAAEIRLAEQFSMGYLQFNVMKRDKLIEKYAERRGLKDAKVTWARFNGPAAMNDALLSKTIDIVAGGVPGLAVLWDRTRGTPNEVKGICALSSQPFLLNTNKASIKTIQDFSDEDKIAVPTVKVSVQAVILEMAAAKIFGNRNFDKLDKLTVSMTPPDATAALMTKSGAITAAFSVPPFQSQQLTQPFIHTVLSSFDVIGPHSFTVAWTTSRFRNENPDLYAAFVDAMQEATRLVNEQPLETASTWIADSNAKLPLDTVASIIKGPNVTWTMAPQNTKAFAAFMHAAGVLKAEPAAWSDLFFPEAHSLPGS
jgi:NitT/TauT family transport system substrate-binding protein